jgi:hypothetical protein
VREAGGPRLTESGLSLGTPQYMRPVQAVIAKLLTERPTRIRTVRDTVPEGIDSAVATYRCTAGRD